MKRYVGWAFLPFIAVFLLGVNIAWANDEGEKTFKKRCSQCHALPTPEKLSSEEWVLRLEAMAPMAGLKKKQKQSVLAYLQDHSKQAITIVSMAKEKKVFEDKCGLCHTPERVFFEKLNPNSRRHIVLRMQERSGNWISTGDAAEILEYLNHGAPGFKKPARKPVKGGAEAVFRKRCSACHSLERVYLELEESKEKGDTVAWLHIVKRMREKSADWLTQAEAKQIVQYLSKLKAVKPQPKK